MKTTKKQYIRNIVIDNLMVCLKTAATKGDDRAVIKLSKYLLKLVKKRGNEDFIHCTKCGRKILRTDNYCMYCGTPTEIKPF